MQRTRRENKLHCHRLLLGNVFGLRHPIANIRTIKDQFLKRKQEMLIQCFLPSTLNNKKTPGMCRGQYIEK